MTSSCTCIFIQPFFTILISPPLSHVTQDSQNPKHSKDLKDILEAVVKANTLVEGAEVPLILEVLEAEAGEAEITAIGEVTLQDISFNFLSLDGF